jgi:hypothetical protein
MLPFSAISVLRVTGKLVASVRLGSWALKLAGSIVLRIAPDSGHCQELISIFSEPTPTVDRVSGSGPALVQERQLHPSKLTIRPLNRSSLRPLRGAAAAEITSDLRAECRADAERRRPGRLALCRILHLQYPQS